MHIQQDMLQEVWRNKIKEYISIKENIEVEIIEKKSRFIGNLIYIESKQEAQEVLKKYKKKYNDARHNCYAYRILEDDVLAEKASDDGEPSKTAGFPMLNILKTNEYMNVIIIVTRYFGGTLLRNRWSDTSIFRYTVKSFRICRKSCENRRISI